MSMQGQLLTGNVGACMARPDQKHFQPKCSTQVLTMQMQMQICSAAGHTKAVPKQAAGKATAAPHRDPASAPEHLQVCFSTSAAAARQPEGGSEGETGRGM